MFIEFADQSNFGVCVAEWWIVNFGAHVHHAIKNVRSIKYRIVKWMKANRRIKETGRERESARERLKLVVVNALSSSHKRIVIGCMQCSPISFNNKIAYTHTYWNAPMWIVLSISLYKFFLLFCCTIFATASTMCRAIGAVFIVSYASVHIGILCASTAVAKLDIAK